jgi:hypothetical protein
VAVMVAGRVHCAGSPSFLKRRLGAGYTLTLAHSPTTKEFSSSLVSGTATASFARVSVHATANSPFRPLTSAPLPALARTVAWVRDRLGHRLPATRRAREEVKLILPFDVALSDFFEALEAYCRSSASTAKDSSTGGQAISFGVEMPSLESVFLRVTSHALGVPNPEEVDELLHDDDDDDDDDDVKDVASPRRRPERWCGFASTWHW